MSEVMTTPRKTTKLECALTVSLCITFVLLICLIVLIIPWRIRRSNEAEGREQMLCEPCSSLGITGAPPHGCNKTKEERCCCKASWVIGILVKKIVENKFDWFTNKETAAVLKTDCAEDTPSGKIAGLDYHYLQDELRETDLVYWNTWGMVITDTVRYSLGRFFISVDGVYEVFSQIKYGHDVESAQNPGARQTHSLHRYSFRQGRTEKLAENTRTFSQLRVAENNGTSFIVAVIRCNNEDQLMIKSSHTHVLSGDHHENVFGLYFIST